MSELGLTEKFVPPVMIQVSYFFSGVDKGDNEILGVY